MSEGEEYLLKWNDYHSSFLYMMENFCLSEEMVDCTISTGSKKYSAHKIILATCSSYFRSLLATVEPHQHPIFVLHDIDDGLLEMLLKYMYSGKVNVTEDKLVPLVTAAKDLEIKGLIDVPVEDNQQKITTSKTSLSIKGIPQKVPKIIENKVYVLF